MIQNVRRGGHGDHVDEDRFTDYSGSSDESSSSQNIEFSQMESHNESDDEYENDDDDVVAAVVDDNDVDDDDDDDTSQKDAVSTTSTSTAAAATGDGDGGLNSGSSTEKDNPLSQFDNVKEMEHRSPNETLLTTIEVSDPYDDHVNMNDYEDDIQEHRDQEKHETDLTETVPGLQDENSDIDFSDTTTTTSEENVQEEEVASEHDGMNMEESMETDDMDLRIDLPSSSVEGRDSLPDEMDDINFYDASSSTIQENDESILNHNQVHDDDVEDDDVEDNDVEDNDQSIPMYDDMQVEKSKEKDVDLQKDTINAHDEQSQSESDQVSGNEYDTTQPSDEKRIHQDQSEVEGDEGKEQDYPLNDVVIDQQMHEDISADMADVETDFTTNAMTDDAADEENEIKKMSNDFVETDFHSEDDSTRNCDSMDFADAYDDDNEFTTDKAETSIGSKPIQDQESEPVSNDQEDTSGKVESKGDQLTSEDTRQVLRTLSYSEAEVAAIKPSVAQVIVNKMFKRPKDGIPSELCMEEVQLPLASTKTWSNQWSIIKSLKFDKDILKKVFAPVIATAVFIVAVTTSFSSQDKSKRVSSRDRILSKESKIITPVEKMKADESKVSEQEKTSNDDYLKRRYI